MVKFREFYEQELEEAKDPKMKMFNDQKRLADQLNKYGHRWGEKASNRMVKWVDTYNDNKHKMIQDGIWQEFCDMHKYDKTHNGYDCMA